MGLKFFFFFFKFQLSRKIDSLTPLSLSVHSLSTDYIYAGTFAKLFFALLHLVNTVSTFSFTDEETEAARFSNLALVLWQVNRKSGLFDSIARAISHYVLIPCYCIQDQH